MSKRDYINAKVSKAFSPAAMKEMEEAAFQRAFKARAAARKPGYQPHPQSIQAASQRRQQMLTRTTGVSESRRWGGSR
jgi:hypothetical protein